MFGQLGSTDQATWCERFRLRHVLSIASAGFIAIAVVDCDHFVRDFAQEKDVRELTNGMNSFRERFGALPPSADTPDLVRKFVRKAFPIARGRAVPAKLDSAQALVYWLSGVSTDPRAPFDVGAVDRFEWFAFPEDRVRGGRFYPELGTASDPYVYFCAQDYENGDYHGFRPYYRRDGVNKTYFAMESMQIVGPGRDGKLGRGGLITELSEEDRDNVVSFDERLVGEIALGKK